MKLYRKWILDVAPKDQPEGSWRNARNVIWSKTEQRLINEYGFELEKEVELPLIGIGEVPNRVVLFSTDGKVTEIGTFDETNGYQILFKTLLLNSDGNYPICAFAYTINNLGEVIICWSNNKDSIYYLNIDNLPFTLGYAEAISRAISWGIYLDIATIKNNTYQLDIIDSEGSFDSGTSGIYIDNGFPNYDIYFETDGWDNKQFVANNDAKLLGIKNNGLDYVKFSITDLEYGSKWLIDKKQLNQLKLFPSVQVPNINVLDVRKGTSELTQGVYQFAISYLIGNSQYTNVLNISKPVYLVDKRYIQVGKSGATTLSFLQLSQEQQDELQQRRGNDRDERETLSGGAISTNDKLLFRKVPYENTIQITDSKVNSVIDIEIENIDISYDFFRLMVIRRTGTSLDVKEAGLFKIESDKFNFSFEGQNTGTTLSINDITIASSSLLKAKSIVNWQNELLIANGEEIDEIEYQKYANLIRVYWDEVEDDSEKMTELVDLTESKYGNENLYEHDFPYIGFTPNEIYALYVHLVFADGTASKGYHIPGRVAKTGETSLLSALGETSSAEQALSPEYAKYFHTRDTSSREEETLGYWENDSERYPNDDNFNSVELGGQDLRNTPVRHHKMPSYKTLYNGQTGGTFNKFIGLRFSNIIIPDFIKDRVIGFFFSYAKRESGNYTVIGQQTLLLDRWDNPSYYDNGIPPKNFRLMNYPLLAFKPKIGADYIQADVKVEYKDYNNTSGEAGNTYYYISDYPDESDNIALVEDVEYIPENNDVTEPSNRFREECLYTKVRHTTTTPFVADIIGQNRITTAPANGLPEYMYIGSLINFKRDIYNSFYNQKNLIPCTDVTLINKFTSNFQTISFFRGDCFIRHDKFAIGKYMPSGELTDLSTVTFFQSLSYSKFPNYGDTNYYGRFFTPYNNTIGEYGGSTAVENWWELEPSEISFNKFNYALDFLFLNDIITYSSENSLKTKIKEYKNRIWRTNKYLGEDKANGWRVLLPQSFYDLKGNKGSINNMVVYGNTLFIHTEYTLYAAKVKDILYTEDIDVYLGRGDLFDREPIDLLPDKIGYLGNLNQIGVSVSKHGYAFVNRKLGKVFLVKEKYKEISNEGISELIKYYSNIFTEQSNEYEFINGDNPYKNNGIILGYEEEHNRLLLTLKNKTYEISGYETRVINGLHAKVQITFINITEFSSITLNFSNGINSSSHTFIATFNSVSISDPTNFQIDSNTAVSAQNFINTVNVRLGYMGIANYYTISRDTNTAIITAVEYGDIFNFDASVHTETFYAQKDDGDAGNGAFIQEWSPEGHYVSGVKNSDLTATQELVYTVQQDGTVVGLFVSPVGVPDKFELLIDKNTGSYELLATSSMGRINNQGSSSNFGYPNEGDFDSNSGSETYVTTGIDYSDACDNCNGGTISPPPYPSNLADNFYIGWYKKNLDTNDCSNVPSRLDEFNTDTGLDLPETSSLLQHQQVLWVKDCSQGWKIKVRAIGGTGNTGYNFSLVQFITNVGQIQLSEIKNQLVSIDIPIYTETEDNSITLSYSFEADGGKGGWISRHDYIPSAYFNLNAKLYKLVGNRLKFQLYQPSETNFGNFEEIVDYRIKHFWSGGYNGGKRVIDENALQDGFLTNANCADMSAGISSILLPPDVSIKESTLDYGGTCVLMLHPDNNYELVTRSSGTLYDLSFEDRDGNSYHYPICEVYNIPSVTQYFIHASNTKGIVASLLNATWTTQNEYFYFQQYGYDKNENQSNPAEYILVPKLTDGQSNYLTGFPFYLSFLPLI